MKVLVVGQGGREHAIVRALRFSPSVDAIHAVPGHAGMEREAVCHMSVAASDGAGIESIVRRHQIDLVVIGPEMPLARGLSDHLRNLGIAVFGPSQQAAKLESSKIFAKEFMHQAEIPTAHFQIVGSVNDVLAAAPGFTPPYVLKADGLAAGKGVLICQNVSELEQGARQFFESKTLGEAGNRAVIEQFMPGYELSLLILTNGKTCVPLPVAQDHKRLRDREQGPNTGGMGCVAPLFVEPQLQAQIERQILQPLMRELARQAMLYRGVLYLGLMITKSGPQVLEFNCRFGDPEAQVLLPIVRNDWGELFWQVARGEVPEIKWNHLYSACVVLSAEGYPDDPVKGTPIEGELEEASSSYFLHAGTILQNNQWLTNGGRVLNAVGIGSSLEEAVRIAYSQARQVSWPGMQMRTDIGQKVPKIPN